MFSESLRDSKKLLLLILVGRGLENLIGFRDFLNYSDLLTFLLKELLYRTESFNI